MMDIEKAFKIIRHQFVEVQREAEETLRNAFHFDLEGVLCVMHWAKVWGFYSSPVSLSKRQERFNQDLGPYINKVYEEFFVGEISQRDAMKKILLALASTLDTCRKDRLRIIREEEKEDAQ